MDNFLQGFLIALIPALLVSVITAYITVRLSVKQFSSQRWWENKAEAYSHIIERLSELLYCSGKWLNEIEGVGSLGETEKKTLRDEYAKASLALGKASAIGAYVVSEATADALEKLMREVEFDDPNGDWYDEVNRIYDATKECMTKVRANAQLDLLGKK